MPSHKMMSFCFLLVREGGRNSATISFLNRVRNMMSELSPRPWPVVCEGQLLAHDGITNRPQRGAPPSSMEIEPQVGADKPLSFKGGFHHRQQFASPASDSTTYPIAPLLKAARVISGERFSLTKRILDVGANCPILPAASIPFRVGRPISNRIKSGRTVQPLNGLQAVCHQSDHL